MSLVDATNHGLYEGAACLWSWRWRIAPIHRWMNFGRVRLAGGRSRRRWLDPMRCARRLLVMVGDDPELRAVRDRAGAAVRPGPQRRHCSRRVSSIDSRLRPQYIHHLSDFALKGRLLRIDLDRRLCRQNGLDVPNRPGLARRRDLSHAGAPQHRSTGADRVLRLREQQIKQQARLPGSI